MNLLRRRRLPSEPQWVRRMRDRQRPPVSLRLFLYGGIALWFAGGWMFEEASFSNPHHPDVATGHIYALGNPSVNAYVTRRDYIRVYGTMVMGLLMVAAAASVAFRRTPPLQFPRPDSVSEPDLDTRAPKELDPGVDHYNETDQAD